MPLRLLAVHRAAPALFLAAAAIALAAPAAAQSAPPPLPSLPPPASEPPAAPLPSPAPPGAEPLLEEPPPGAPAPLAVAPPPPPASADPAPAVRVVETDPPDPYPMKMNSPGLFIAGIIAEGAGFVGLVTGLGLFYSTPGGCTDDCPDSTEEERDRRDTGFALILGGGIAIALGVPALIIGGKKVPDKPSWAGPAPAVLLGPRGGALRWTF
ncbi:MAG: hypothetical protein IT372_33750 [Polyangiaceae bacterium]|nr:hypothetical protein [Polyangiaceae bacterium]